VCGVDGRKSVYCRDEPRLAGGAQRSSKPEVVKTIFNVGRRPRQKTQRLGPPETADDRARPPQTTDESDIKP